MTTYRVEFEVEAPEGVPIEDVEAFYRFDLGEVSMLEAGNALYEMEPFPPLTVRNVDVRRA
jgi:hypothetical protein